MIHDMIPSSPSTILSFPFSLPPSPTNPNPINRNPSLLSSSNPSSPSLALPFRPRSFRCPCRLGGHSSDPNAETVRSGRFRFRDENGGGDEGDFQRSRKRRWWSDDLSDGLDQEFDPLDDDDDGFEQPWDRISIFKVFRSYGYLLPAIIASMLLATGPKAFLMALALPLGQSALSLAMEKVWGPKTKPKTKRKPYARSSTDFGKRGREESSGDHGGRQGYRSWVSADVGGAADERSDSRQSSSYGGWDELDGQRASMRRQPASRAETGKKGKLSTKRGRHRGVPLFLRLLIAVFPFLGSWTKIL